MCDCGQMREKAPRGAGWCTKSVTKFRYYPPEPLYRELPEPASYPLEALGDVLHPMAKAMQEIIQAPAALCGTSVLTAAALAVQPHGNIEIDRRICPASLYGVTVAVSGER